MPSPHMNGVIYQKQSDHFEKIAPKIAAVSARNVGELVFSLVPLDDTGLHLLDGAVLYGNGPYADFVDYIQGLYTDGNHTALFETEANWQSCVTTYGACGKFVVDTTNDTVRLPKLSKGFLEATIDASALGDLVDAGLPNITGEDGTTYDSLYASYPSGAFASKAQSGTRFAYATITNYGTIRYFDASLSNPIYGNSSTVQPQSIKGFIYMVLANKVRNPMNLDVSQAVRGAAVPVGTIIMSANATVPQGYLLCDGSAVGRGTYPELFEAIGTTYGTGDGSTTFNLPDLIGKFLEGAATAGVEHEAGLPNIEGTWSINNFGQANESYWSGSGALYYGGVNSAQPGASYASNIKAPFIGLDASKSNSIYGNSNTVQPPSLTALPCIKAFSSVVSDGTVVIGNLASEVQGKINLDGSNLEGATVKTVVETWRFDTEWYRVWSDGWIEQGGLSSLTIGAKTINLHKPFSDTNYTVVTNTRYNSANYTHEASVVSTQLTTSSFGFYDAYAYGSYWYACGY